MEAQLIKISNLKNNTGQLNGLQHRNIKAQSN